VGRRSSAARALQNPLRTNLWGLEDQRRWSAALRCQTPLGVKCSESKYVLANWLKTSTCSAAQASSRPNSVRISSATRGAIATAARAFNVNARKRLDRTSVEVAALDQSDVVAATGRVERDARARRASADHEEIPRLTLFAEPCQHFFATHIWPALPLQTPRRCGARFSVQRRDSPRRPAAFRMVA